MPPLNEIFWSRVKELLAAQGRDEAFLRQTVLRDKNTYTNWFLRHQLKKIKDLEDIANALGVPASVLITTDGASAHPVDDFRLPFDTTASRTVSIEIECSNTGLVVRPKHSS